MTVVGKGIYRGEYEGNKYEKIQLVCECEPPRKFEKFEGSYTEVIICPVNAENSKIQLGDKIKVFYNKYGKVDTIFKVN